METPESASIPGETDEQRDIRVNKDVAAFSYLWIMSVIIFAARRDSAFIRYHSKQGVVLFIMSILVAMIPWIGKPLLLLVVGGMLLGFVNAASGRYADVPVAGPLAKGEMKVTDLIDEAAKFFRRILNAFRQSAKKPDTPPTPTPPSPPTS